MQQPNRRFAERLKPGKSARAEQFALKSLLQIQIPGLQMDIRKVLVLGGSGYVGTYIVNRLSQRGIEVTVPTRRRERTKALIIQPNVVMPEINIDSEEALVSLMHGQDAVINLVGILHSRDVALPYSKDFAEALAENRGKAERHQGKVSSPRGLEARSELRNGLFSFSAPGVYRFPASMPTGSSYRNATPAHHRRAGVRTTR